MSQRLEDIFAELGLSQYLNLFLDQGFDSWETILDITESDLFVLPRGIFSLASLLGPTDVWSHLLRPETYWGSNWAIEECVTPASRLGLFPC